MPNLQVASTQNVCTRPTYLIREIDTDIYMLKIQGHFFIRKIALVSSY